jgi:hypothetical protein
MKKLTASLMAVIALVAIVARAQELTPEDQAIRSRIEAKYDVVPLSDAIGLRPKVRTGDVRLIEVSDTISVNGVVVSGRELREKVGSDADAILRLSYLEPAARRALFAAPAEGAAPPAEAPAAPPARELPPATPAPPEPPSGPRDRFGDRGRWRSNGDRVRIFGDVTVREGEEVSGQVVAVIGSVRIDGEVGDQVVAVLGNVDLGDKAVVRGDIVSVGGRVRRAPGAQVRGGVTEVALADGDWNRRVVPWMGGLGFLTLLDGFGAVPRLIGTAFRVLLLLLFASMAMVVARPSVEGSAQRVSDNPLKATLVGLAAEILFVPLLVLTCIVLAITIVGIPLLFLMPFVVLLLLLLALVGFTGTALAIGQWARRRFGLASPSGFADVWLGILIIVLPVLLGRLIGLGGFLATPFTILLVAGGLALEFLAWSTGLGAMLTNTFSRWQARRAMRPLPSPPAAP